MRADIDTRYLAVLMEVYCEDRDRLKAGLIVMRKQRAQLQHNIEMAKHALKKIGPMIEILKKQGATEPVKDESPQDCPEEPSKP